MNDKAEATPPDTPARDVRFVCAECNGTAFRGHEAWCTEYKAPPDTPEAGDSKSGYGNCPMCGAPGISCERSPNGNTQCQNGHNYPHRDRVYPPVTPSPVTDDWPWEAMIDAGLKEADICATPWDYVRDIFEAMLAASGHVLVPKEDLRSLGEAKVAWLNCETLAPDGVAVKADDPRLDGFGPLGSKQGLCTKCGGRSVSRYPRNPQWFCDQCGYHTCPPDDAPRVCAPDEIPVKKDDCGACVDIFVGQVLTDTTAETDDDTD